MATKKKGRKSAKPAKKSVKKPAKKAARNPVKARKPVAKSKPAPKPAAKASAPNPWPAYAERLTREAAITVKVMRAFPADQANFQPHPRSGMARQLFWTFVVEQAFTAQALNGTLTMPPNFGTPPETIDELISAFQTNVDAVVRAAKSAAAADWARTVPFFTGPQQMGQVPIGAIAEMMLSDQVHHRGQLSVYLRMAGGKVPSIYGPSADEPW